MDKRTTRYLKEKAILDAERQSIRLKEDPTLILYDNGRLFDEKRNKFCKISLNKKEGKVSIFTGLNINVQKREKLVASYFVTNDDSVNKTYILHKNSDKSDDRAENLEWITYEQNQNLLCKDILEEFSKNNPDIEYKEYHLNSFYIIFNDGRIFSKYICKFMNFVLTERGYYALSFSINNKNKNVMVHRIVAETFVKNKKPNKYKIIDHKDRNKINNHYTNLRWVDSAINASNKDFKIIPQRKVNQFDMEGNFIASYNSCIEAQRLTKTSKELGRCLRGKVSYAISYKDDKKTKFIWKYDDPSMLIKHKKPENSVKIIGYKSYWITNDGRVYSTRTKKFIKPVINNGYYVIHLNKNNKSYNHLVHRLVCEYFTLNKPLDYKFKKVNHRDGNKLNCHIDNLEFVTSKENSIHSVEVLGKGRMRKVTCHDTITKEILKFKSVSDATSYFNLVSTGDISRIIRRKGLYKKRYKLSYDTE